MFNSNLFRSAAAPLLVLALVALIGCSGDNSSGKKDPIDKLIDTASAKIADKVVETAFAEASFAGSVDSSSPPEVALDRSGLREFTDVLVTDDKLYALFGYGLVVHDRASGDNVVINSTDSLSAIVNHQGEIYVGGKHLYTLNLYSLERQEGDYEGGITSFCSYDHLLMIGTENAVYSLSLFGREKLAEDLPVSALASDHTGLWIGTAGEGLYRWDGESVNRRYLLRDTSLFDYVNTLDFRHNHLYVGTNNGLHIYDGGRWQNLSIDDGLPTNNVTSIDASDWTVYVGTDGGVVSFFDNQFSPVERLESLAVNQVVRVRNRLYVATVADGVARNSKSLFKTLIEPTTDEQSETYTFAQ